MVWGSILSCRWSKCECTKLVTYVAIYDSYSGNLADKAALFVVFDTHTRTAGAEELQIQLSPAALRKGEHHCASVIQCPVKLWVMPSARPGGVEAADITALHPLGRGAQGDRPIKPVGLGG